MEGMAYPRNILTIVMVLLDVHITMQADALHRKRFEEKLATPKTSVLGYVCSYLDITLIVECLQRLGLIAV